MIHHFAEQLLREQSEPARWLRALLLPFSWLYRLAMDLRNRGYDSHWFHATKPDETTVISVGNIAVGGTGKTPVTLSLARALVTEMPTAILSRGYRSPAEKSHSPLVVSSGNGPEHPAAISGDEPYLLARNLPTATVIAGRNRRTAASMAKGMGAKLLILDDGLQHRRLARDVEIIVVNSDNPLEAERCLPSGRLRESPQGLKRATLIVANPINNEEEWQRTQQQLASYSNAPVVGAQMQIRALRQLDNSSVTITLQGATIALFCAIGNPQRFEQQLANAGASIIETLFADDHTPFSSHRLQEFAVTAQQRGASCLVCTEKDAVKLPATFSTVLPIYWVEAELTITFGCDHWQTLIASAIGRHP